MIERIRTSEDNLILSKYLCSPHQTEYHEPEAYLTENNLLRFCFKNRGLDSEIMISKYGLILSGTLIFFGVFIPNDAHTCDSIYKFQQHFEFLLYI